MRALLLHTDEFTSEIVEKSTRPEGIEPEISDEKSRTMKHNLTVFFCIEQGDTDEKVTRLLEDIGSTAKDLGTKKIMVSPFAHLSSKTADPKLAKSLYEKLLFLLKGTNYEFETSQFGYHKSLLLKIKGHPGAFRYREY